MSVRQSAARERERESYVGRPQVPQFTQIVENHGQGLRTNTDEVPLERSDDIYA
jgi:hypothetical protein